MPKKFSWLFQIALAARKRKAMFTQVKKLSGPCSRQLETELQGLHIQRQAYHSGSFVGNHIHKMLQVCLSSQELPQANWQSELEKNIFASFSFCNFHQETSIKKLTGVPVNVSQQSGSAFMDMAQLIHDKYGKLFRQFGACHRIFNAAKVLNADEITNLG